MKIVFLTVLSILLLGSVTTYAQNPVLQSGSVTKGHAAKWSAQGVIQDAGPASGGNANVGITDMPIVGTGTPLCIYDAPKSGNATGYHSLCLGANLGSKGTLAYNFGGAASPLPFQFCVNGNCYDFPFTGSGSGNVLGTSPSTMSGLTCFGNTTGTLIKDCDPSTTISTLAVSNLTVTSLINSPLYELNGKVLVNGSDPFVYYNPDGGIAMAIYGVSNNYLTYYKANSHIFQNNASAITAYIDSAGLFNATGGITTSHDVIGGYIQSTGNMDVTGNIAASGQVTGSFLGSTGGINATGIINGAQYNLRGLTFASMDSGATSTQINDPFGGSGGHITMTKTGPSTGSNLYDQTSHFFRSRDGLANYLVIDSTGTFTVTGTVGAISDDSVKTNVIPYLAGLSAIKQLNPVSFNYVAVGASSKAKANPFINTDKQYGLLASNVEPVLPEMVKSHKFFQDMDELKAIFPTHLNFVMINAVKELDTRLSSVETKPIIVGKAFHFNSITGVNGATFDIADIAGTHEMVLMVTGSGAASLTTPTADQIIAAVPGWEIGGMYRFRMANPTTGTLTITPGAGVTITGLPTTASNKWREYLVRYVAVNSVDFRDIGSGTD